MLRSVPGVRAAASCAFGRALERAKQSSVSKGSFPRWVECLLSRHDVHGHAGHNRQEDQHRDDEHRDEQNTAHELSWSFHCRSTQAATANGITKRASRKSSSHTPMYMGSLQPQGFPGGEKSVPGARLLALGPKSCVREVLARQTRLHDDRPRHGCHRHPSPNRRTPNVIAVVVSVAPMRHWR
jgi:hypothetical protein